jgi:hypothetical protein
MIQERMKASQSRQKSYHDKWRMSLEFQEGDHVFLRVTLVTGVGRTLKSRWPLAWTNVKFAHDGPLVIIG